MFVRFGVQAAANAHLLLSGVPANSINYTSYTKYVELCIGGWYNNKSIIRLGTMSGAKGIFSTPFILDNSTFR